MKIGKFQQNVHVATESVAVFVIAPFLIDMAFRHKGLTRGQRMGLAMVAIGTVVVDGGLLFNFHRKTRC